ncbi:MAG: response regulator [Spirochaetales bacterium]|nr:response regulator [Spirochaetales bacterium]
MVARPDSRDRIGSAARAERSDSYWIILVSIVVLAAIGIVAVAWQRAELRRRFALFSEHAMETAFHLHDMTLRVAELASDDFAAIPADELAGRLASYRVTIAAQYANVAGFKLGYFESVLATERPETLTALRETLDALEGPLPALLLVLRAEGDALGAGAVLSAEGAAALREAALEAMRAARAMNDRLRYAEALAFVALRDSLEASGRLSLLAMASFALISTGGIAVLGMARKATRERVASLRSAKDAAERQLVREREFLANTSHELRTPVSGMLGVARMLAEAELPDSSRARARDLLVSAEDLSELVDLVLGSQDEDPLASEKEIRTSLVPLLGPVIARYRATAEAKGLSFAIADRIGERELELRPRALLAVLRAVLSNAVKFTDAGSVRLEFEAAEGKLFVLVKDTGIGMDAGTLERSGERFFQAEGSHTKRHRGLGLGLWTAHRIVAALGGSIAIASEPGEGTEVRLALPVGMRAGGDGPSDGASPAPGRIPPWREDEATARPAPARAAPPAAGGTVFIAEDDAINRLTLDFLLRKAGYTVLAAADGAEAIDMAGRERYDLAILDIAMPFHTGIDVVKAIRSQEAGAGGRVKAFALTGHSTAEDRAACMDAGFDEFISKPYSHEFLMERVRLALA